MLQQINPLMGGIYWNQLPAFIAQEILGLSKSQAQAIFLNMSITKKTAIVKLRQWAFEEPQS